MTDLIAARGQMTVSLAFHILFAVAGMAMPLLMTLAEARHLATRDPIDRELSRRWAKGTAILFAVGAVSGTVLSFELGLLWPRFMAFAGPIVGVAFSLEGFAFFLEAIFLGLFLYGFDRLSPRLHLATAVMVAASGLASGVFVMAVNAWMHTPTGFTVDAQGALDQVEPWATFQSASFPTQSVHMALAAYSSVAFAVLGIHAFGLWRRPKSVFHRRAAELALGLAVVTAPLQVWSGDRSAKHVALVQPLKLAAAEALFEGGPNAPLAIGGWPDVEARALRFAIEIPSGLSLLGKGDPDAIIEGLDAFPREEWPNVPLMHLAFQVMVGCGFAMLGLAAWGGLLLVRRRSLAQSRAFLAAAMAVGPLGLVALEAGWIVTEVGRQPWIIRGVMRVADAITPMPHLVVPFSLFTVLYLGLGIIVIVMLRAHVFGAEEIDAVMPPRAQEEST